MRVLFLGTSAAEALPGIFCNCMHCKRAIEAGGKNLRLRSSVLLNGELLIDLSPDFGCFRVKYGLDVSRLRAVLITHTHQDHLSPQILSYNSLSFTEKALPLKFFMSPYAAQALKQARYEREDFWKHIEVIEVKPYKQYRFDGYYITPVEASHNKPQSLLYLIEHGESRLFYATDTGAVLPRAEEFLAGKRLDIVCLDATSGKNHGKPTRHLGFMDIIEVKERFLKMGCCDEDTLFLATHFTHFTGMLHEEIEQYFKPYGIKPAYDGLAVEK
jgi:phosphoribosyl 1,2-cyclic phosphate phosphodiesterase